MNVLLLGSGGREHALAWKLKKSELCEKLYVAPGNPGTAMIAKNVNLDINNFIEISEFILQNNINMLVVGPEDPLVNGITDYFKGITEYNKLKIIGPSKNAAMLEGSKDFAKQFMTKYNIPTAGYFSATLQNIEQAKEYLTKLEAPYVLKADGLAAGKGVLIIEDIKEAQDELENMLNGKFGEASSRVVIEEFLSGIECSVFALTDGKNYVILPEAKDYKRIGEKDTGLNTGGMGAISPVPFYDAEFREKVENRIIKPTIKGIEAERMDYVGFVFFGLINVNGDPYVIEYNVRMGDPETEVVMPRLKTDLLNLLDLAAQEKLDTVRVDFEDVAAATIILVSGGYPESYEKDKEIQGLNNVTKSIVFHAGTKEIDGKILSSGGRVLAISSYGQTIFDALRVSYDEIHNITFDKMYYRNDLGFDLL